ncbi:hypothetical protein C1T31_05670 [Hanstruepera neustonica]|uniref:Uncharacterized protein n=1 Tax=Hanstruepera neustonica TaxID=1445657 RepID=A0A2K1E0L8_9FLAO|nr:T9SS sorting signal type C domain-containing protein [Hanstruepera neustonica]PNQ73819.1 hypothetical protein C1T31_05670 [Hanstruepera neustonica]
MLQLNFTLLQEKILPYHNPMVKFVLLVVFAFAINVSFGQTVLLSPTGGGGFESLSFDNLGWRVTSDREETYNQWVSNAGAEPGFTGRGCAYITNNAGFAVPPHKYTYSPARVAHIYRDISVPAGESEITVDFKWIGQGQSIRDRMRIWIVPITYAPIYGTEITPAADRIRLGGNYSGSSTWSASPTLTIPRSYAGTTFRFVVEWANDDNTGADPPAAIDDISIISDFPPIPVNDEPCNAILLSSNSNCTYSYYTNYGASDTSSVPNPGCANYGGSDVWFRTVVPASGGIIVDTQIDEMTDGGMALYSGTCGSLTLLSCDDNTSSNGLMPQIMVTNLTPGQTVYIRVWENGNNNNGTFGICVTPPPPPPSNDECSNAIGLVVNPSLICNDVTFGSTAFATQSPQPDNVVGVPDNDVWFSFVATNTNHQVSLLDVNPVIGSNTNMGIGVYNSPSTNCSSLNLVTSINSQTLTINGLNVGDTYFIRVYGFDASPNAAQVNFNICVSTTPDPPPNNYCSSAIGLPVSPICNYQTFTNAGAAATTGVPNPGCANYLGGDVWFYVVVDDTGEITIDTEDLDMTNGGMAIYSGNSCSALSLLDCDDNSSANGLMPSITRTGLTPGEIIYIRVWEEGNDNNGTFGICVTSPTNEDTIDVTLTCPGNPSEPLYATLACTGTTNLGNTLSGIMQSSDPVALQPIIFISSSDPCSFDTDNTSNYSSIDFTVTTTGTYVFTMNTPAPFFDAMGYIYVNNGNFNPGSCATGIFIAGDDDDGPSLNPQITATLTAGVQYTLVTTKFAFQDTSHVGPYQWNVLGPPTDVDWYTTETGGSPIASGATFNPVGVSGSNLPDTNTPGVYSYWVTCPGSSGPRVKAEFTIGKIWKGTVDSDWNNINNWKPIGKPTANDCVFIENGPNSAVLTYPNAPIPPTPAFAKNFTVGANASVELSSGTSLTVTDWINVSSTAEFLIRDSANLIQITNVTVNNNTGNIKMQRTVPGGVSNLDYVYWSSPVDRFDVNDVSPGSNRIYKWIPTQSGNGVGNYGEWIPTGERMTTGKGYIIRGLSGTSPTPPAAAFTTEFSGKANNGKINVPIQRGTYNGIDYPGAGSSMATAHDDNWNLIGNPYPSSISARDFITANALDLSDDVSASIMGTVYLWRHLSAPSISIDDPFYGDFGYNYNPNDYIKFNHTGSSPAGFSGYIGAGQAFFILMDHNSPTASSQVTFGNSMRHETHRNDQFYRTTEGEPEHHRIWIDLIASNNMATSLLVGYIEGATNQKDRLFDGLDFNETSTSFYSLIGDEKMAIQGKALPFMDTDIIPLGIEVSQSGHYSIAINKVDGLFESEEQAIFLEDTYLNIIHDLRLTPYEFNTDQGEFNDRFILRYTSQSLGVEELVTTNDILITAPRSEFISILSSNSPIDSVSIYDMLGRELVQNRNINKLNYRPNTQSFSNGVYLVTVNLQNGKQKKQRVILK